jgi:hypothetical protein
MIYCSHFSLKNHYDFTDACLLAILAHAGDLSLLVLGLLSRMNQSGLFIELGGRFSLPANIGDTDLEPSITVLDLRSCCLTGL